MRSAHAGIGLRARADYTGRRALSPHGDDSKAPVLAKAGRDSVL
ncbi:hypothetical protein SDC9_190368 [bioreactor metagenome]|uniref:Uncharacterized protein n=1 Tax=bioreactor metagenome TaxID=1076179 RepID=A0A645HVD4_9ZZZZ